MLFSNRALKWLSCSLIPLIVFFSDINANENEPPARSKSSSRHPLNQKQGSKKRKSTLCRPERKKRDKQFFQHPIKLQLSDSLGFPVYGTEFWVLLDITQDGPNVKIQLPAINFETGPTANFPQEQQLPPQNLIPGGYLYTSGGFLPEDIRPNDLLPHSIIAASNNGLSAPFSFTQPINTLPTPPVGYIVQVTNAGALVIQCAGTFGNIIPPGRHILLPTEISYTVKPKEKLSENVKISCGATDTTQFSPSVSPFDSLRDMHVNDAFENVFVWAWTDNSMIADKTNGTLNVMVAIGEYKHGKLHVENPIQLTNLPPGRYAWDTSVAINRTDKHNIVVSWADGNVPSTPYRAVSFDGGKTWPYNGPTNIQPVGTSEAGDNRGVLADRYGNIWYGTTNLLEFPGGYYNQPTYWISTDGGVTFSVGYTAPLPPPPIPNVSAFYYDFPQYCFGGDGLGNYGLHFQSTLGNRVTGDAFPTVGFVPITGLGALGTPVFTHLEAFTNSMLESPLTASLDGRVWFQGFAAPGAVGNPFPVPYTYINAGVTLFKSPGNIYENYAGAWHTYLFNQQNMQYYGVKLNQDGELPYPITNSKSQPTTGYFPTVQDIEFDEKRQALYALCTAQIPDESQNMAIYLIISRDNGQTWSAPIEVSTTQFANRGFASMSLDPATGHLVFGWYDGRHDKTYKSVEYFGAVFPAKKLDQLVMKIPLANPVFNLPPATTPPAER